MGQDASWAHHRELRSTVTMMRYLARTSSQPSIHDGSLQQAAVADRRRREASRSLRTGQFALHSDLQKRVHTLAASLEADAHHKVHAKAVAAAASKQAGWRAEQAARIMGAVAPHRPAAMGAALAVVAPSVFPEGSPPSSPLLRVPAECEPSLAPFLSPGDARNGRAEFRPRCSKYLLRSCCRASRKAIEPAMMGREFLSYTVNRPRTEVLRRQLISAGEATLAPWTLRQQYRSGGCCLLTEGGGRLHASPAGEMTITQQQGSELSHFLILPIAPRDTEIAASLGLLPQSTECSPHLPTSTVHISLVSATRSVPLAPYTRPTSGGLVPHIIPEPPRAQTAVGGRREARVEAKEGVHHSQLVRIFHRPSGCFVSANPATGQISLKDAHQVKSVVDSIARGQEGHWDVVFEMQPHTTSSPRLPSSQRSKSARPKLRDTTPPCKLGGGAGGGEPARPPSATLPMLGFNMSTGKGEHLTPSEACFPTQSLLDEPQVPRRMALYPLPPSPPREAGVEGGQVAVSPARRGKGWQAEVGERARARQAESAWDSRQLDLKAVLASGPLLMSDFMSQPLPPPEKDEGAQEGKSNQPLQEEVVFCFQPSHIDPFLALVIPCLIRFRSLCIIPSPRRAPRRAQATMRVLLS
ncbi:MAG: hypothetical protein SGPRY_011269 [Prymnesium sp.]